MIRNRSMPPGDVVPVLAYPEIDGPSAWLRDALGFRVRLRIGDHRVQLSHGSSGLVVAAGDGTRADSTMVRVDDVDIVFERAIGAGASAIVPPTDQPYGERQASIVDPWGHAWTLSESIADIDPRDWGGEPADPETAA